MILSIGIAQSLLAILLILGMEVIPPVVPALVATLLVLAAWFAFGNRFRKPAAIPQELALLLLLLGAGLHTWSAFPQRATYLWMILPVFAGVAGYLFRLGKPHMAFFLAAMGVSSPPFTELSIPRDPWCSALLLFAVIAMTRHRPVSLRTREWGILGLWSLFILVSALSAVNSVYPYQAVQFAGILLFYLLLLIMVILICRHQDDRELLLQFILLLAGLNMAAALWAVIHRMYYMGFRHGIMFRIFVFTRHPNYVIYPTVLALPLWIRQAVITRRKWVRLLSLAGLSLSILYLFGLSYSRGGWLIAGFYFLAGMLAFRRRLPVRIRWIAGLTPVLLFLIMTVLSPMMIHRVVSIFKPAESLRVNAWLAFMNLVPDRPVLGFGLGTNRFVYPAALADLHPFEIPTRQFLVEAHNLFVDVLTGTGIAGLGVVLLFLLAATRLWTRPRSLENLWFWLIGGAIWIDLFFNFRLHAHDTGFLLFVYLGLVFMQLAPATGRIRRIPAGLFIVLAAIILINAVRPWTGKHLVTLAQARLDSPDWRKINRFFSAASVVEPLNAHIHFYLAQSALQTRRLEEADRQYTAAIAQNPNYSLYREYYALNLLAQNRRDAALEQVEIWNRLEPYTKDARALFMGGMLHQYFDRPDTARWYFLKALLLNTDFLDHPYWENHQDLKYTLIRDSCKIEEFLVINGLLSTGQRRQLMNLSTMYIKSGRPDFARQLFIRYVNRYPRDFEMVCKAAIFFIRTGEPDRAKLLLQNAMERDPDIVVIYLLLGYLHYLQGDLKEARQYLETSNELWSHISLDNLLGYQLLEEIYLADRDTRKLRHTRKKLAYLTSGQYETQQSDLTIHGGSEWLMFEVMDLRDYLQKAVEFREIIRTPAETQTQP